MKVVVNHEKRFVDVWLARGEAAPDIAYICRLLRNDASYDGSEYDVCRWFSGTGSLTETACALLRSNLAIARDVAESQAARLLP